jgi:hypothetical protein
MVLGRLTALRLTPASEVEALGPVLYSYLKLKLRIAAAGFEACFFDYDWRRSVLECGRLFATKLQAQRRPSMIVAHSLGGLVARAALALEPAEHVSRIVMLGTPNFGSFGAVQTLRGSYSVVRNIARLDLRHSAQDLSRKVFTSFASLYELLPHGGIAPDCSLHEPSAWPRSGPRPDSALLRAARDVERHLRPGDERFTVIAGVGQPTVVALERRREDFLYTITTDGDGTVPRAAALLPGTKSYFATATHTHLSREQWIAAAVTEILQSGATTRLPGEHEPHRDVLLRVTDRELLAPQATKLDWAAMSHDAQRAYLDELNEPPALHEPIRTRASSNEVAYETFQGDLALAPTAAVAAGVFSDVQPGGAAASLDQRLDGAFSDFWFRRIIDGSAGRVTALPAEQRLPVARLALLVGLGSFADFGESVIEFAAENLANYCLRANLRSLATVAWGAGAGLDQQRSFEAQLRGFRRALAGRAAVFDRVVFCTRAPRALRAAPASAPAPHGIAYLLVNRTEFTSRQETWRTALLTSSSPAAIISESVSFETGRFDRLLGELGDDGPGLARLTRVGRELAELTLHERLRASMAQLAGTRLVVVHDAACGRAPWETLHVGGGFPAIEGGMSRRYAASDLSLARFSVARREDERLSVLLVSNPTGDLPGAELERERVERILRRNPAARVTVIAGRAASRARLRAEFESGDYDVLHYAGHASFNAASPAASGVLCSDGALVGADLGALARLPSLVVFNACESGRVRRARARMARVAVQSGLAESFMRGGVANYVGTYWPVSDSAAVSFASSFYDALASQQDLGSALLTARRRLRTLRSADWADYLHYGDPAFHIKL